MNFEPSQAPMSAAQREVTTLDEKLYLQVYGKPETHNSGRAAVAR
jgi:hypothetical protein